MSIFKDIAEILEISDDNQLTRCEEIRSVEAPEHFKAVDENEDRQPEDAPYRKPGLQVAVVNKLLAVESLCLETTICIARLVSMPCY